MDAKTAEKIVNEFGKVIEQTASMTYGIPKSLLPCRKEEIKEAIKLCLASSDPGDQETRKLLKVGYITLAMFIPDEDAKIASKFQIALESGDIHHKDWQHGDQATEILRRIEKEEKALLQEINAFIARLYRDTV